MILLPETPIFYEWIALVQHPGAKAHQLAQSLRSRLNDFPLFTGPEVQISLEDFERAQRRLRNAADDPAKQDQIERHVGLGCTLMAPPPDAADWQSLIHNDAASARRLYLAFQAKCAALGLATPRAIPRL